VIEKEKEEAKSLLDLIMKSEVGYLFTKDPEYISLIYSGFDPKESNAKDQTKQGTSGDQQARQGQDNTQNNQPGGQTNHQNNQQGENNLFGAGQNNNQGQGNNQQNNNNTVNNQEQGNNQQDSNDPNNQNQQATNQEQTKISEKKKTKKEILKQLIHEIRSRINTYFSVNVKQMADVVPKIIGFYLIQNSLHNMHFLVYRKISTSEYFANIKEPDHIVAKRKTLNTMLEVLRNSRKILLRDPDLAYSLSGMEKSAQLNRDAAKLKKSSIGNVAPKSGEKTNTQKFKDGTKDIGNKIIDGTKKSGIAISNTYSAGKDMVMGDKNKATPSNQRQQQQPSNTQYQQPSNTQYQQQTQQQPSNTQYQQQAQNQQQKPGQNTFQQMGNNFQEKAVVNVSNAIGKQVEKQVNNQLNQEINNQKQRAGIFDKEKDNKPKEQPKPEEKKRNKGFTGLFG